MPIADPASTLKNASVERPAPSANAGARLLASLLALALAAPSSACVPAPFTFEETGAGGSGSASSGGGGETSSTTGSSSSSSSSSTGSGMNPCIEGTVCVEAVPAGWTGPELVLVSPEGGAKPPCPLGEMAEKLFGEPPNEKHGCTACSCTINNASCSAPEITCWAGNSTCSGAEWGTLGTKDDSCINDQSAPALEDQPGSCSLTAGPSVAEPGTCSKSGGSVTNAPDWGLDVHVCNAPPSSGVACGAGGTCEPLIPGQQLCIRKEGTEACPAGWDLSRVDSFSDADDSRGCTSCNCNPVSCSGGEVAVFDTFGCSEADGHVHVDSSNCFDVPNIIDGSLLSLLPTLGSVVQNGCSGGGNPVGEFTPLGPVTFCCKN